MNKGTLSRFNLLNAEVCAVLAALVLMPFGAQASMEDPSDYSEYTNADSFKTAYPAAVDQTLYPEFSWDRVPRFIVLRSDRWISDAAVERVSTNCFMVFQEKYNRQGLDYTEDGTKSFAARLKAVNPDLKNLFYWNSRVFWDSYSTDAMVYTNGYISNPDDSHKLYDHDVPGMSHWWLESIIDWIGDDDNVDGVFVDAIGKYWGEGSVFDDEGYPDNDYLAKLVSLKEAMPEKFVAFNGINNMSPNGGRHYLELYEAAYRESSATYSDDQPQAEAFAVNIQLYREAAAKGKVTMWRGFWDNTITGDEEPSKWGTNAVEIAEREQFYEDNCCFHLAMFLMAADEYSYFGYQGGDYAGTGENGSGSWSANSIWDTSYIEAFQNPLGEPMGPPVQDGYQFSRSFKYLDVSVNTETYVTSFEWKDPAAVDTNLLVYMTSPVSGITLEEGDAVELEAGAADSDAVISKVEFYCGEAKLGEDTAAPYSFIWDDIPAGQHRVTARAYDTEGNSTNSLAIYINAEAGATDETVFAAADNAFVYKQETTTPQDVAEGVKCKHNGGNGFSRIAYLRFDISDLKNAEDASFDSASLSLQFISDGSATVYVHALNDGISGETTWNSSSLTWNTRPDGTVSLDAAGGNSSTSDLLGSHAVSGSGLVDIDLSEALPAVVDEDTNGEITLLLSTDSISVVNEFASIENTGGYAVPSLTLGLNTPSAVETNEPPLLYMMDPSDGDRLTVDGLYAFSSDSDGTVSQVDFYQDGVWLGSDRSVPFSCSLDGIEPGIYTFTAAAVDSDGRESVCTVTNVIKYPEIMDNLAFDQSTSQSSTAYNGGSELAVDGNTDGDFSSGSVTHTDNESNAWWQVDLAAAYHIGEIRLFNRDSLQDRLSDFTVSVITGSGVITWSESVAGSPDPSVSLDAGGALGQIVRVQLNGTNVLSLAEVEVYENKDNLALGCGTSQSSTPSFGGGSSLAVDGDTNGSFWDGSVTHTDSGGPAPAWWQVDLGTDFNIRNITVYNRTDSNMDRLSDFTVTVIDSLGVTNWSHSFTDYPDPSTSMDAGGAVGRYVRIDQDSSEVLSLAEVEVYGCFSTNSYSAWVFHEHGLSGIDALTFADTDGDGLSQLGEYAFGGDPTDAGDAGYLPGLGEGGTNDLYYVYPRRIGSDLIYTLEFSGCLVSNEWSSGSYTELPETGRLDAYYETVTNRVETAGKTNEFIRLKAKSM